MTIVNNKYVRCRYCDTGMAIRDLNITYLFKEKYVQHEKVNYICPVCDFSTESFVFNQLKSNQTR